MYKNNNNEKLAWRKGELIGKGSFGKVYLGMHAVTGELLAVKRIRLSNSEEDQKQANEIMTEVNLIKRLIHPNIVQFIETQRNGQFLDIIMEYVPGKSLDVLLDKFGAFSEKICQSYTKQLLSALSYCHNNNVAHRDIKGKNLLIDTSGMLKVADFGSAKKVLLTKEAPSIGYNYTPLWTAPEVIKNGEYNLKVDVWSAGCVVIEMATSQAPWAEEKFDNPFRALYHIGNTNAIPKLPPSFSELGIDFLKQALTRDPDQRPTAEQLMKHEWLSNVEEIDTLGLIKK